MHVVVVMDEHLDDPGRPMAMRVGADEDELRAGPHEPIDQVLRQRELVRRVEAGVRELAS